MIQFKNVRFLAPLLSITALVAFGADLRLVDAAKNKDTAAVRALLKEKVDVNASRGDGATALFWTVHWDDRESTDLLIAAGANARVADDLGTTPLSMACTNRSSGMIERLLTAGADPKSALKTGETVLMTCSGTGAADAVKMLLDRGAEVNAKDGRSGQTALMWAATEGHPEVVRLLLDRGADVHARSKSGFTALLFAARHGDLESAKMLIAAGADVNETAASGMTPLLMATASGHESLAIFLLDKGANPNVTADINGITPLHWALLKGVSSLRSFGADEPLSAAFYYRPNMNDLVQALLKHGANPNARLSDHPAEMEGSDHISWLAGSTPFLAAASVMDATAMRILGSAKADTRAHAGNGMTAVMFAARLGARPVALNPAQEKNAVEAAKVAVEFGADVNAVDKDGQTALHLAAGKGMDSFVQFLLDKGAQINAKDKNGLTPLDVARGIEPGQPESNVAQFRMGGTRKTTIELLLKSGAVGMGSKATQ